MNLLDCLKENYNDFTDREKLLSNFFLSNKENVIGMSAKEIGESTNTSAATVVRFSKKLGFSSLNEMKLSLTLSSKAEDKSYSFKYLNNDLKTQDIIYGVKDSIDNVMNKTVELIDEKDLETAINLLINAKNIYIYCVGVSSLVGLDFYYKLNRINKRCILHSDAHLQITSSVLMEKGDVAIAISYSGNTLEVLTCVENAKKKDIPVISITKASLNNELEQLSDVTLKVPFVEKLLREGAMSSRISQLAVIDMLFIGIARQNLQEIEENLILTRKAVEDFKKKL
ncbi:MurR/RpiR family transcriptional regulator (plasmid) [Cetobacterium somerae]|jgi:DNA-binding MurR/RpiR family transcriptional regulator|uniref:MurR/RpiR family transcriptional regulator n=1 Tax=Cetobacterium somerae TaxID=188913 RepID=UPI003D768453